MTFLPPVVMEIRANAAQFISEQGKVIASVKATAKETELAAQKEAAAARAAAAAATQAADKQALAADTAAKAVQVATDRRIAAEARATEAQKKAAQIQADSLGVMTEKQQAAYDKQTAAAERAANSVSLAAAKEAEAQKTAADAATLSAEKQAAASRMQEESAAKAAAAQEAAATRSKTALASIGSIANKISLGAIAGAAVVGGVSLEMASKFEKSTMLLVTAGGEAKANLANVQSGILAIAEKTGTSTDQLSEGMYVMEKAGYHGADGLKVLTAAAEGAKAENVDLATMTQAVTDVLLDYGKKATDAVSVTNQMVAASGLAKTTMQDFANSMAAVVPIGSAVGLTFDQLGGAIATMTQHGESAQQSSQNLANLIQQLQKPSNIASGAMQQLGINATDLSKNLGSRGLSGTLDILSTAVTQSMGKDGMVVQDTMKKSATAAADLRTMIAQMPPELAKMSNGLITGSESIKGYTKGTKDLGGSAGALGTQFLSLYKSSQGVNDSIKAGKPQFVTYNAEMAKLTGGITGFKTATMLMMNDSAQFTANIKAIGEAGKKTGVDISTWADTQHTLSVQLDQAKQMVGNLGIEVGMKLVPAAKTLLTGFTDLFHGFEKGNPLLETTATIIGVALTISVVNFTKKMILMGVASIKSFVGMGAAAITTSINFVKGFAASEIAVGEFATKAEIAGAKTKGALKGGLGAAAVAAGILGGAFMALSAAQETWGKNNTAPQLDQVSKALANYAKAGNAAGQVQMDNLFKNWDSGALKAAPDNVNNLDDAIKRVTHEDFNDSMNKIGDSISRALGGGTTSEIGAVEDRFKSLDTSLGQMVNGGSVDVAAQSFDKLALAFTKNGKSASDALDQMPAYKQALVDQAGALGQQLSAQQLVEYAMGKVPQTMIDAMGATQKYTDAAGQVKPITPALQKSLDDAGVSADGLATDLNKVLDGMLATGMAVESARSATENYNKALTDARSAVKDAAASGMDLSHALNKNRTDFDLTTAAGAALNDKFTAVKDKGLEMAKSLAGPGVNAQKKVQDALTATYNNMITAANGMGIHGKAAVNLTRDLLGIPPNVNVKTWMDDYARKKAADTAAAIKSIPPVVDSTIRVSIDANAAIADYNNVVAQTRGSKGKGAYATGGLVAFATGGMVGGYPSGGLLRGPGSGTSDSMLARVSNGEFVVRAASVAKYGPAFLDQINKGVLAPAAGSGKSNMVSDFRSVASKMGSAASTHFNRSNLSSVINQGGAQYEREEGYELSRASAAVWAQVGRISHLADQKLALAKKLKTAQAALSAAVTGRNNDASAVSGTLSGEFKMGDMVGMSAKDMVSNASGLAAQIKAFGTKMTQLRGMGLAPALIQQVAALGSVDGSNVADSLIAGGRAQIGALDKAYASISVSASGTGMAVANGVDGAAISGAQNTIGGLSRGMASLDRQGAAIQHGLTNTVRRDLHLPTPRTAAHKTVHNTFHITVGSMADGKKLAAIIGHEVRKA